MLITFICIIIEQIFENIVRRNDRRFFFPINERFILKIFFPKKEYERKQENPKNEIHKYNENSRER